ncbi:hypothetical protein AB0K60_12305 [Thermopolyspora sp. NPDC052614]|uniref:hypothetical protein n=1 Tax=Thermopolyspora sp. NPDC052614 TaxID=3155682 RepID=UPI003422C551
MKRNKGNGPRQEPARGSSNGAQPWKTSRRPEEDRRAGSAYPSHRRGEETDAQLAALTEELPERLRKEIGDEVEARVRGCLRQEVRREIEDQVRHEIKAELRAEYEKRLDEVRRERTRLDPTRLATAFSDRTIELLHREVAGKAQVPTSQQIAVTIKQGVLDALRSRRMHLAQLAEIDRLIASGELNDLPLLLREWFTRAGLTQSRDAVGHPEYFTVVNGPEEGIYLQVIEPAYIDEATGQVIRAGRLRHADEPEIADDLSNE